VDGAIHRRAGPELARAGRLLGGCRTGEAKLTPGFRLPARFVIHTVGPVWRGGGEGEADLLAACYRSALAIGREQRFVSVAFPAISTGIYGFPRSRAADIAVQTLVASLTIPSALERVILVAFDEITERLYLDRVEKARQGPS
jgi:O-acetyl-ADP-ribose deacetylase (regulator of RNase III)